MPRRSSIDVVATLEDLLLLSEVQMRELREKIAPRFSNPSGLGEELRRRGWLTSFQLERIERGDGRTLVLGAYRLLEPIGGGGMGRVFKARHTLMDRIVAIKEVHPGLLGQPDALRRFRQEIVAAAKLHHANVIVTHDAQEVDGRVFLVMEHCDGIDLARAVAEIGRLPVGLACDYIRQAALGLQHVHEHGLVHRDIKPQNLLVAGTTIKILDLGLARLRPELGSSSSFASLTGEGILLGTPDYVAPEQATDARVADIRSDIYSLGCTFFFLLADQAPFPGGALMEKLLRHQFEQPTPLNRLRPEIPAAVLAIVDKMMAKSPEDRFQTPREVAEALVPWASTADAPVLGATSRAEADESTSWVPPAPDTVGSIGKSLKTAVSSSPRISRRTVIASGSIGLGAAAITAMAWYWPFGKPPENSGPGNDGGTTSPIDPLVPATTPNGRWRAGPTFRYEPKVVEHDRKEGIFAVVLSPNGQEAAVGFGDPIRPHLQPGVVRILHLPSGQWREIGQLKNAVSKIAFVDDGKTVVATSGNLMREVKDSGFGELLVSELRVAKARVYSLEIERLNCLAVDPRGKWAAVAGTMGRLRRVALDNGRILASFDHPSEKDVTSLAVSSDGSRVAVGYHTGAVDIRDSANLIQLLSEFPVPEGGPFVSMSGLAFRFDDQALVGTTSHIPGDVSQIKVWDLAGSLPPTIIPDSESHIRAMALAADGRTLATGTSNGMVRIWDLGERRMVFAVPAHTEEGVFGLSFAKDARTLASCSADGSVRLWVND